jgi:DNA-binding winged helix-turn-helix (wHTH) protein
MRISCGSAECRVVSTLKRVRSLISPSCLSDSMGGTMENGWHIGDADVYEESRRVEVGKRVVRLHPQQFRLLAVLIENQGRVVGKDTLIRHVWGLNASAGDHDLQARVFETRQRLGCRDYIETIPGIGYRLAVQAIRFATTPQVGATLLGEMRIFPGAAPVYGPAYVHSWVTHGKGDSVRFLKQVVTWEPRARQLIPLSHKYPSTLRIPFRHGYSRSAKEAWWVAAIALSVDSVTGNWRPLDLSTQNLLLFEARAEPIGRTRSVPIKIRLEDDSTEASGPSYRQSTSWYAEDLKLVEQFNEYEVALDSLSWTKDAWPSNTKAVNRKGVVQLVFGQDATIPACAGHIEIRDVRIGKREDTPGATPSTTIK